MKQSLRDSSYVIHTLLKIIIILVLFTFLQCFFKAIAKNESCSSSNKPPRLTSSLYSHINYYSQSPLPGAPSDCVSVCTCFWSVSFQPLIVQWKSDTNNSFHVSLERCGQHLISRQECRLGRPLPAVAANHISLCKRSF